MGRARLTRLAAGAATIALALGASSGCLLGNIRADACADDTACARAFGVGSTCEEGFCTEPGTCRTGHDCRRKFGGGACVSGICSLTLPPDPGGLCTTFEPPELASLPLAGKGAPQLVGAIYRLGVETDKAESTCTRLATREINRTQGLSGGRNMAMVVCDASNDKLTDEQRKQRVAGIIDYLGGTLGVPFAVGPPTSTDSLNALSHLISQQYPTVLISPSATSPTLTTVNKKLPTNDQYPLFWRTVPSDILQANVLAKSVVGQLPTMNPSVQAVAVVYVDDNYGNGLQQAFGMAWGGNTTLIPFKGGTGEDWTKIAGQVAASAPDAVLIISVDPVDTVAFITAGLANGILNGRIVYATDGSLDAGVLVNTGAPNVQSYVLSNLVGTTPGANTTSANFKSFSASLQKEFGIDANKDSFTAYAYDAAYFGAMGVVYAQGPDGSSTNNYTGVKVAEGLTRLHSGSQKVEVGSSQWPNAKTLLTSGDRAIDLVGVSGGVKFDVTAGEPTQGPIQVWQPANDPAKCKDPACGASASIPCICTLKLVLP